MRTQRQKMLLQRQKQCWSKWRRASRKQGLEILQLLHLQNQIAASGSVIQKKP